MPSLHLFSDPIPEPLRTKLESARIGLQNQIRVKDAKWLREAIRVAYVAIEEACEPHSVGMLEFAVQQVANFFPTFTAAQEAAAAFPALVAFRDYVRGPVVAEELPELLAQAEAAELLAERLLEGFEVWSCYCHGEGKMWEEGPLVKLHEW